MSRPNGRETLFATLTLIAALLVALATARAVDPPPPEPRAGVPVLVELFTSEGCSSCPPADELLVDYHARGGPDGIPVLVLSQHVDYWNRLGWRDPFSSRRFTERQMAYAQSLGVDVYTPQLIVDGRQAVIGSDQAAVAEAIREAWRRPRVSLRVEARRDAGRRVAIDVTAEPSSSRIAVDDVELLVALVEDGLESQVTRGENAGRRLAHAAVVRALERAKSWDARTRRASARVELEAGWRVGKMRVVAFLQGRDSRQVVGAGSSPVATEDDRGADFR